MNHLRTPDLYCKFVLVISCFQDNWVLFSSSSQSVKIKTPIFPVVLMWIFLEEHLETGKKKPSYSFCDRLLSQYIFEQIKSQILKERKLFIYKKAYLWKYMHSKKLKWSVYSLWIKKTCPYIHWEINSEGKRKGQEAKSLCFEIKHMA